MVGVFVFHDLVVNIEKDSYLKSIYSSVYPEGLEQNCTNPPSKCFQVEKEKLNLFTDYILKTWRNVRMEIITRVDSYSIRSNL